MAGCAAFVASLSMVSADILNVVTYLVHLLISLTWATQRPLPTSDKTFVFTEKYVYFMSAYVNLLAFYNPEVLYVLCASTSPFKTPKRVVFNAVITKCNCTTGAVYFLYIFYVSESFGIIPVFYRWTHLNIIDKGKILSFVQLLKASSTMNTMRI